MGGRKGVSVVQATAAWLATPLKVGGESDLETDYDLVDFNLAANALEHHGIDRKTVELFRRAWQAPRIVTVAGKVGQII